MKSIKKYNLIMLDVYRLCISRMGKIKSTLKKLQHIEKLKGHAFVRFQLHQNLQGNSFNIVTIIATTTDMKHHYATSIQSMGTKNGQYCMYIEVVTAYSKVHGTRRNSCMSEIHIFKMLTL